MDNLISILSILTTVIVSIILNRQIKSQKTIITSLQDYIKATDWKEVKEFYDVFKVPAETSKAVKPHLDEKEEMIDYIRTVITNANRLNIDMTPTVVNSLSSCKHHFQDILSLNSQHKTDD